MPKKKMSYFLGEKIEFCWDREWHPGQIDSRQLLYGGYLVLGQEKIHYMCSDEEIRPIAGVSDLNKSSWQ